MATFLDLSLIGFFGSIFLFLLVFAIVWGLLTLTKIFSGAPGEKGLYGLIAIAVAIGVVVSPTVTVFIATLVPWFAVFIIVLFLIFIVFRMFSGGEGAQISEAIRTQGVAWTMIVVSIIIVIVSFSSTFGQDLLDEQNIPVSNIDDNNELSGEQAIEVENDIDSDIERRSGSGGTAPVATGSTASDDFGDNVLLTIVNPKVMGMIVMMIIAFLTVLLIARTPDPDSN